MRCHLISRGVTGEMERGGSERRKPDTTRTATACWLAGLLCLLAESCGTQNRVQNLAAGTPSRFMASASVSMALLVCFGHRSCDQTPARAAEPSLSRFWWGGRHSSPPPLKAHHQGITCATCKQACPFSTCHVSFQQAHSFSSPLHFRQGLCRSTSLAPFP